MLQLQSVRQPCSILVLQLWLMLQFQLGCYSPGWETQSSVEAENALCRDRGEADLHREESPPWSLIDLFLCK